MVVYEQDPTPKSVGEDLDSIIVVALFEMIPRDGAFGIPGKVYS